MEIFNWIGIAVLSFSTFVTGIFMHHVPDQNAVENVPASHVSISSTTTELSKLTHNNESEKRIEISPNPPDSESEKSPYYVYSNGQYAYDKNGVYYRSKDTGVDNFQDATLIIGADPATFSIDFGFTNPPYNLNFYKELAKDKNHIYFNGSSTPFVTKSFKIVDSGSNKDCGWSTVVVDENGVYIKTRAQATNGINNHLLTFKKFEGAIDLTTFIPLGDNYFKDAQHVWAGAKLTNRFSTQATRAEVCDADGWG